MCVARRGCGADVGLAQPCTALVTNALGARTQTATNKLQLRTERRTTTAAAVLSAAAAMRPAVHIPPEAMMRACICAFVVQPVARTLELYVAIFRTFILCDDHDDDGVWYIIDNVCWNALNSAQQPMCVADHRRTRMHVSFRPSSVGQVSNAPISSLLR